MITRREVLFGEISLACDMIVLLASLVIAYELRALAGVPPLSGSQRHIAAHIWILWIVCPVWGLLLRGLGLCRSTSYRSLSGLFTRLVQVQCLGGLILMTALYLMKLAESRIISQAFLAVSFSLLLAEKVAVRAAMAWRARNLASKDRWSVLVVGSDFGSDAYFHLLREHSYWAVEVADFIAWTQDLGPRLRGAAEGNVALKPRCAFDLNPREWHEILQGYVADEVVAVVPWQESLGAENLAASCCQRGVTFRLLVQMPPAPVGRYHVEDIGRGAYLLSLESVPQFAPALLVKRLIDIVGALLGLVLCGLAHLWYSRRIRRESPGPVLFPQTRIGQNGRIFTMYKFRTMHPDAEQRLPELMKHNEMRGLMFKMQDDPRVTSTGKWMRKTHLDELPQFWNVFKGEMSLVGTRPPTPSEVANYSAHHYRRLSMKPGVTGLWQLNGNGKVNDFEEVVRLDCEYIDHWSLRVDFKILAMTVLKVIRGAGW